MKIRILTVARQIQRLQNRGIANISLDRRGKTISLTHLTPMHSTVAEKSNVGLKVRKTVERTRLKYEKVALYNPMDGITYKITEPKEIVKMIIEKLDRLNAYTN